jgi:hypothetical protein
MSNIKKLKDQVEHILDTEPKSRNSDILLTQLIWKEYYPELIKPNKFGVEYIKLDSLYELPREDNIKRHRAKFQSHKNKNPKYLPTDPVVAKKRGWEEEKWRYALGYNPEMREPDYIEEFNKNN